MADDSLLDQDAEPKDKAPEPVTHADLERLQQSTQKSLSDFAKEVTASVAQIRQSQPQPTQDPDLRDTPNPSDGFLDELVKDGEGAIAKVVQKTLQSTLGPWVQNQVTTAAEGLTEHYRTQVDRSYGEGTYDEVLVPEMEKIFSQLDPQSQTVARGNKATFEAILKQARGEESVMEKLAERRAKNPPPEMLDQGRQPNKKASFSQEDTEFMSHYEKETGRSLDKKVLLDMIESRKKGNPWSAQTLNSKNKLSMER